MCPLYEYQCPAGHKQEKLLTADVAAKTERLRCIVVGCGRWAIRIISPCNFTFGWKLSDESHNVKGTIDKFVRDI